MREPASEEPNPTDYGLWWVLSEICYYLGLVLAAAAIPALTLILWIMSLVERADPNYWYLLITWLLSALMFATGIGLKNLVYSATHPNNDKSQGRKE